MSRLWIGAAVLYCALCGTSSAFGPSYCLSDGFTIHHGSAARSVATSSFVFGGTLRKARNQRSSLLGLSSDKDDEKTSFPKSRKSPFEMDRSVVKKARAQAKLNAILSSPDAHSDLDSARKKVSLYNNTTAEQQQQQRQTEEQLDSAAERLESEMYKAVSDKDYVTAHQTKMKLNKLHMDDYGYVLQANSAFYKAFSQKDYEAMEKLWLKHDASCTCIHPTHPPLVGADTVLDSWKQVFSLSGGQGNDNNTTILEPIHIRLAVKGTMAIVTCDEEIYTQQRFVKGKKRQVELVNKLTATNIFRKVSGKWYLVHHHATWHADSGFGRHAVLNPSMTKNSGIVKGSSSLHKLSPSPPMSAESILGIPGNEGLSGKKKGKRKGATDDDELPGPDGPIRRVFMGNLNDLLNGGLVDLLGGTESSRSDDDDDDDGISIEYVDDAGNDEEEEEDENNDDDDDDDEEGDDIKDVGEWSKAQGNNGATIGKATTIVMGGFNKNKNNAKKASLLSSQQQQQQLEEEEISSNDAVVLKDDTLRQNCISALRKLTYQGVITSKQKRMLLTDIIMCSAKGEFSMVEVAYELLCGEENDDAEEAKEEFVDQCRVFALSLPEFPSFQPQKLSN